MKDKRRFAAIILFLIALVVGAFSCLPLVDPDEAMPHYAEKEKL